MKKKLSINHITIRARILVSMIVVSLISTIVLGSIVYSLSKKTIETNYKNAHVYQLEVSSKIIDIELSSIIDLTRTLLVNSTVQAVLLSDSQSMEESTNLRIPDSSILERVLRDITSQDYLIAGVSIVSESGKCLFAANRNDYNSFYYNYYASHNIMEASWLADARVAQGKEVFYGYNILNPDNSDGSISFSKNLINPTSGQSMGFVVVNIQEQLLEKAFGTIREGFQTNRNMIVDSLNPSGYIYFNGTQEADADVLGDYINGNKQSKYLFSIYQNKTTGWLCVNIIEKNELNQESSYIGLITVVVCIGLISFSLYISGFISGRITKPLKKLERVIEEVGEGNRNIVEDFDDSEIGQIGQLFKSMVHNNLDLRERLLSAQLNQREAELLLLQSQIYPHFLYNTLDSLYCMAIIKEEDDIAAMVLALSNMFKLSLNKGEKTILVRDEIQRMTEYMTIQNMRYNNRFDFQMEVEEEVLDYRIITFILQPFVENAVYHGLEPKLGPGSIRIRGKKQDNLLVFSIQDDGVGMSKEDVSHPGFGIKNVMERIRLYYGEGYGVIIDSQENQGTSVYIRISTDIRTDN